MPSLLLLFILVLFCLLVENFTRATIQKLDLNIIGVPELWKIYFYSMHSFLFDKNILKLGFKYVHLVEPTFQ